MNSALAALREDARGLPGAKWSHADSHAEKHLESGFNMGKGSKKCEVDMKGTSWHGVRKASESMFLFLVFGCIYHFFF